MGVARNALRATALNIALGGFGSLAGAVRGAGRIATTVRRISRSTAQLDRWKGVVGRAWERAEPAVGVWNRRRVLIGVTHVFYNSLALQLSFDGRGRGREVSMA